MKNVLNYELARLWYCQTHRWLMLIFSIILFGYLGSMYYLNDQYDMNIQSHYQYVYMKTSKIEAHPLYLQAQRALMTLKAHPHSWKDELNYLQKMKKIPEGIVLEENLDQRIKELKVRIKEKLDYHNPYAFLRTVLCQKFIQWCAVPMVSILSVCWGLILLADKGKYRQISPYTHGQILRSKLIVGSLVTSFYVLVPLIIFYIIGSDQADIILQQGQIYHNADYLIYVVCLFLGLAAGLVGLSDERLIVSVGLGFVFACVCLLWGYAWLSLVGFLLLLVRFVLSSV